MATIEFVDQTLRDGQQSLWGMRMRAGMVTPVGAQLDATGYRAIELTGGAMMEVIVRNVREDPWEGLDHIVSCLPNTHLRGARRATAMGKFGLTPPAMLQLFNRTLIRHGIESFWIYDCLYNMAKMEVVCRDIAADGAQVYPAIMFGLSPVHTDEFFAARVREMASWGVASGIYFEDASGILAPERTATLVPALIAAADGLPIEFHAHNTVGLGTPNYIKAIECGITIVQTCSRPLANGPSIPSVEMMVQNVLALGHDVAIDTAHLEAIAEHWGRVAEQEGWEVGVPREYDASLYQHQMPGGMTGTLKAQLAQHGMADRFDEVVAEVAQIRGELGYPISATPFSQLLGVQAVLNVTTGERYGVIPDEIIMFALGHYGDPPVPIDPEVLDRVLSCDRAKAFADWELPQPDLDELRRDYGGAGLSDEELILRYLAPVDEIAAARAAGPLRRGYRFATTGPSAMALMDRATQLTRTRQVDITLPQLSLSMRR